MHDRQAQIRSRPRRSRNLLPHPHPRPVHARRPERSKTRNAKSDTPANIPLLAACRPPCIAAGSGPCASTPAWATPRNRTSATSICWRTAPPGLSVAFDLPTQIGLDSDHPLAVGEVGKVGVAIDSIEDMQRLFDGIDLTKISTSMTINATASILLALYVAVARRQGADIRQLSGTVQNDVLKEYIARGTYIFPPAQAMRIITDLFAWTNQNVPEWNTISISGYHMREAGSTAVQEVAFTLANGIAYVQGAIDAGLDVDKFAPRLSFFFNAHNNFLEEVAKFRAARRMWAGIMREHFKAKNPALVDAALPYSDRGLDADRAAAGKQYRPHRAAGAGRGARAAPSRCTPIPTTRRSPCPPSRPRASRCAPSKSWLTSPASRRPSTRWPVRTTSRP